jgi:general secretion pathway protein L
MLAKPGPIALYLPAGRVNDYKTAINADPALEERINVQEATWTNTVQAARSVGFNLMAGLNNAQTSRIQWQTWRWPLILASLVLIVNITALNYDYWNLKREAQALRLGMMQTYKATFPKDTVVVFPLEQMRKKLDLAQRNSGQPSPDDFTLLLTQFGDAWNAVGANRVPKLVSIEYKDHALVLQVKGDMPQKELQTEFDSRGLVLKKNNADVWQVRNAK